MTEEIICRYKFQNNEKFNGKEYCTLFNEVCSDVEFVCDKNCQVYEDYKQLKRLEQENKELKLQRDEARIAYNSLILDIVSDIPFKGEIGGEREISIKDHLHQMQEALALLEEINLILDELKQQYDYMTDYSEIKEIQDKINEVLNESR